VEAIKSKVDLSDVISGVFKCVISHMLARSKKEDDGHRDRDSDSDFELPVVTFHNSSA